MANLCLDCYEVYHESIKTTKKEWMEYIPCPKKSCMGIVIEVDELLLVTIKILNQKGYMTRNCCGGHIYDSCIDSYIQFEDEVELPRLPPGYKYDEDLCHLGLKEKPDSIRKRFKGKTETEIQNSIFENAKGVLKWAESLEEINW